jgi:2-polyprenyl-3-methyl-5-hydroxy-6-metoxy-1,4-benzoquinol methylase
MGSLAGATHGRFVHGRRVRALVDAIAPLVETGWHVIDVGCGDGTLASLVARQGEGVQMRGFEVLIREDVAIPVQPFDGRHLPAADNSVDAIMLIDVLHHTDSPVDLLREAARVARQAVIIKDHRTDRPFAYSTLRVMDWVGNRSHGVRLPYNYLSMTRWREAWKQLDLTPDHFQTELGLYPWPASWLFGTGLHFLTRLRPTP